MGRTRFLHVSLFLVGLVAFIGAPLPGHGVGPRRFPAPTLADLPPPPTEGSSQPDPLLIYALYYDAYLSGQPEEAFAIINIAAAPQNLEGWLVTDGEVNGVSFPPGAPVAPGQIVWATRTATAFREEFGFAPDFEYGGDSDPTVPDMSGTAPAFADNGDEITLLDLTGTVVDALVYEGGDTATPGWNGPAVYPYTTGYTGMAAGGQILYRKLDQTTGLPVQDTDTVADWAQATDDDINGKKVRYPGWDLEHFFFPLKATESAELVILVAPDNVFDGYLARINEAATSIYIEGYSFDNAHLANALAAKAAAGVEVRVLLEEEIVAGIGDQEKWVCRQIEAAGGECWFLYNDSEAGVHDRYAFQHAKFTVVDGATLLMGSENLNYSSMPADDKTDGTQGNRGAYFVTDAPSLIAHALDIFAHDLDTAHKDVRRWDPAEDSPPSGFTPSYDSGGTTYTVRFSTPFTLTGTFDFEVVQSPENSLRSIDSLLGMVARAGDGDIVLVEQLYERLYWGPTSSDPQTDPNPRLESYIDAARHGAAVRILLDSYYDDPDDPRRNTLTCAYVDGIAAAEGLDLACLTGNPTGTGIHNKMVLVWDGPEGWVHVGSINGSENSVKNNRELALQVRSADAYRYLSEVFWSDWVSSGGERPFLDSLARDTWNYLHSDWATENYLPYSWRAAMVVGGDYANPAEIGLYALSWLAAYDLARPWSPGWAETEAELNAVLDRLRAWQTGSQSYQPHGPNAYQNSAFYQWYWIGWNPPVVGAGPVDHVVPSIDNAWLAACLITIREYAEVHGHSGLAQKADAILRDLDLALWYDDGTHSFSWGDTEDPQGGGEADYYSNENRLINFIARAQGQLTPEEFALSLSALQQPSGDYAGITVGSVNWDGSYFTYGAPGLFIRERSTEYGANTVLPAAQAQMAYAADEGYDAWGLSDCFDVGSGGYVQQGAPPVAGPDPPEALPGLVTPHASALVLVTPLATDVISNLKGISTTFSCAYDAGYAFRDSVMANPLDPDYGQCSERFSLLGQAWIFLSIVDYEDGFIWRYFYHDSGVLRAHIEMYGGGVVYLPVLTKAYAAPGR